MMYILLDIDVNSLFPKFPSTDSQWMHMQNKAIQTMRNDGNEWRLPSLTEKMLIQNTRKPIGTRNQSSSSALVWWCMEWNRQSMRHESEQEYTVA